MKVGSIDLSIAEKMGNTMKKIILQLYHRSASENDLRLGYMWIIALENSDLR